MDLRDLILKKEEKVEDSVEQEKVAAAKKKTAVEYSIEVQSGCDFAIRRKTSKSDKLMVVLVSQKQFYIKDCKDDSIKDIDAQAYADFMSDCHDTIVLDEVTWLEKLERGKDNGQYLINLIDAMTTHYSGSQYEFAKRGYFIPPENAKWYYDKINSVRKYFNVMPKLYMYAIDKIAEHYGVTRRNFVINFNKQYEDGPYSEGIKIIEKFDVMLIIATAFGIEWGKKYIDTILTTGVEIKNVDDNYLFRIINESRGYYNRYDDRREETFEQKLQKIADKKANNQINYDAERFIEYITYDAMRQGYRNDVSTFISTWSDYLDLARNAYRRVKIDKYPDYLLSEHQKLIFKKELYEKKIDEEKWQASAKNMAQYEYKPGGQKYQIISPKRPEDMYDEAQQQQNCLASYVKRVTNGEDMIFFLRSSKKETANLSVVTIEVFPNGKVGQVLGKNNHRPSFDQLRFVKLWADAKGFEYNYN